MGGKAKLTGKMIDKLTVIMGLQYDIIVSLLKKMRDAIWATFYHYSSIDQNPKHDKCPAGKDFWCEWQRAAAKDELQLYEHIYDPLTSDVLQAMSYLRRFKQRCLIRKMHWVQPKQQ